MTILSRLWKDDRATASSAALMLITTIAVLGATVGLATVRIHIVQELRDVAVALDNLDQGYNYDIRRDLNGNTMVDLPGEFHIFCSYTDPAPLGLIDANGAPPERMDVTVTPTGEIP